MRRIPVTTAALAVAGLALAGCGGGMKGLTPSGLVPYAPTATAAAPTPGGGFHDPTSLAPDSPAASDVGSLTPQEIVERAESAVDEAASVHVTGTLHEGSTTVSLNVRTSRSGAAYGTVVISGAPLQLVASGNTFWMRTTPAGWRTFMASEGSAEGNEVATVVGSRWIKGNRSSTHFEQLDDLLDIGQLLDNLSPSDDDLADAQKQGTATEGGVPVVVLQDATSNTRYEVATAGKPYPMALSGNDTEGGGTVHFDSWDAPVHAGAPSDGDVIDTSTLPGF